MTLVSPSPGFVFLCLPKTASVTCVYSSARDFHQRLNIHALSNLRIEPNDASDLARIKLHKQ